MSLSGEDLPPRSITRSGRYLPTSAGHGTPEQDDQTGLHMCMALIQNEAGLTWTGDQTDFLRNRLKTFCIERKLATLLDLYFYLRHHPDGPAATRELVNLLTITETSFFRATGQWEQFAQILAEDILEVALSRPRPKLLLPKPLRIWSAGCSSGEEPYTILLTLLEAGLEPNQFSIFAWDINAAMIARARRAEFPGWTLRRVTDKLLAKYFQPTPAGEFRLSPAAADAVEFQCENLLGENVRFPADLDFIFCRNVLIYFSAEDARRLVLQFLNALRPGGVLFLSPTESLHHMTGVFEVRVGKNSVCYQKPRT
ncbi:MAG TPA: CheR family methyltransferase [Planctomycetota bacterium]|nr:CheR family methyltransferase [Planctomycetota bacterium]